MKRFADLYEALDATTSTLDKVAAMKAYFGQAPAEDAAWGLFFLTGQRIKRLLSSRSLAEWALAASGLSDWLFTESIAHVGDFAETIALILPVASVQETHEPLHSVVENRLLALRDESKQRAIVDDTWRILPERERYVFNKLITGELRVGVSQTLVMRALAELANVSPSLVAHRLMGTWQPTAEFFSGVIASEGEQTQTPSLRPYPFYLAAPFENPIETLGPREEWQVEWKWDGIRSQSIRRNGELAIWSRGEDLVTDRFPELHAALMALPDGTVIDGEILAWKGEQPDAFLQLQKRIGRKKLSKKVLDDTPVVLSAYDLLEWRGEDIRAHPMQTRRALLERVLHGSTLRLSPLVTAPDWGALARLREESRARRVEGFMLKRLTSPYGSGRKRGDWWKWKIDPYTVDCVLIYAHLGSGRRANLFTDYTFAVWHDGQLLPVAKAYSGLTDEEIASLDKWIRAHTKDRFGPVRQVDPVQVFEIAFEAIAQSPRHKSGIAVRFPRIKHWRTDKPASEADTLDSLRALLQSSRPNG